MAQIHFKSDAWTVIWTVSWHSRLWQSAILHLSPSYRSNLATPDFRDIIQATHLCITVVLSLQTSTHDSVRYSGNRLTGPFTCMTIITAMTLNRSCYDYCLIYHKKNPRSQSLWWRKYLRGTSDWDVDKNYHSINKLVRKPIWAIEFSLQFQSNVIYLNTSLIWLIKQKFI